MAAKITSKQCRAARGLLKWNINDLASRVNVAVRRLESFERGNIQLFQNENTEISDVFKKEGIEFLSDFEVKLKKEVKDKQKTQVFVGNVGLGQNADMVGVDDAPILTLDHSLNQERTSTFSKQDDEEEVSGGRLHTKKP